MSRMSLCAGCSRHVKVEDAKCPFCGAAMPEASGESRRAAGRPPFRAALLFAGAAVAGAAAVTSCGGETSSGGNTTKDAAAVDGADEGSVIALYGPAPVDASTQDAAKDAAEDHSTVVLYGPAPVDGGNG